LVLHGYGKPKENEIQKMMTSKKDGDSAIIMAKPTVNHAANWHACKIKWKNFLTPFNQAHR
jgi:hypothetical protein